MLHGYRQLTGGFSPFLSPLQVDAASRQLAATALGSLLGSAPALASLSAIEALGPWRSVLLPLPTPLELLNRWGGEWPALGLPQVLCVPAQ